MMTSDELRFGADHPYPAARLPDPPEPRNPSLLARAFGRIRPQHVVFVLVAILICYLAIVPVGYLLRGTFVVDGRLTLGGFSRAYGSYPFGDLVRNTLTFAAGATVLSVALGTALAFLSERTDVPGKFLIYTTALTPLVIPGLLYTFAWVFLASPNVGVLNVWLFEPLPGDFRINIFSMFGMILVQGLDGVPLVFLLMMAAFRAMDPSLEDAAYTAGASRPQILRKITMPLLTPALSAAVLIMVVRGLEDFATPAILGLPANIWVFTSRIWRTLQQFPIDYGAAGALSISLLLLAGAGVLFQYFLSRNRKSFETISGKAFRSSKWQLSSTSRWVAGAFVVGYFLIAIVLPMLILLYASTQTFYSPPTWENLRNSTLENYPQVLDQPQIGRAFRNSLVLALLSGLAVMMLSALGAWLVVKTRLRGRWIIDGVSFLPIVIPGLVLGVSLLFVYLRFPIAIYGTLAILFISYVTQFLPYGMRYANASVTQVGNELEEAGAVSGASWLKGYSRITLPLIIPGLLAGFLYVFAIASRELSSSILLYSPGNEVLAVVLFELWENAQLPELAALGNMLVVLLLIVVAIASRLSRRIGMNP